MPCLTEINPVSTGHTDRELWEGKFNIARGK